MAFFMKILCSSLVEETIVWHELVVSRVLQQYGIGRDGFQDTIRPQGFIFEPELHKYFKEPNHMNHFIEGFILGVPDVWERSVPPSWKPLPILQQVLTGLNGSTKILN